MPERPCAVVFDQRRRDHCRKPATTFTHEDGHVVYYCPEHGRKRGALDLDPTDAARAEAKVRAHDRVSPDSAVEPVAAVSLFVEAFVAGAQFAASRLDGPR